MKKKCTHAVRDPITAITARQNSSSTLSAHHKHLAEKGACTNKSLLGAHTDVSARLGNDAAEASTKNTYCQAGGPDKI